MRLIPALALALGLAAPALAGESPSGQLDRELSRAEARLSAASEALSGAGDPPGLLAELSGAIGGYEAALALLREDALEAAARESAVLAGLDARRIEIERLLAGLQAKGVGAPPPSLHPAGPLAAARASAMMSRLGPILRSEAEALAGALSELDAARGRHGRSVAELAEGLASLDAARRLLERSVAEGAPAPAWRDDPEGSGMLRRSETLSALAGALARRQAGRTEAEPRALSWPTGGEILRGYNAPDAAGVRRPGLTVAAAPLSAVTAPADAVIRYAGPFLDYGYVAVLEVEGGAMIVLAGLAQLRVESGAMVRDGEVLGVLGGRTPSVEEYLMVSDDGTGAGPQETLYIEIRHGQGPVDPKPWFPSGNE